jgi:hypothetical protein
VENASPGYFEKSEIERNAHSIHRQSHEPKVYPAFVSLECCLMIQTETDDLNREKATSLMRAEREVKTKTLLGDLFSEIISGETMS